MQDNVLLGHMPKRIIIGCVENAAVDAQYTKNLFLFNYDYVNFLPIYVDEQPIPYKPLVTEF